MHDVLYAAEKELPNLLRKMDGWQSLFVNYHPPFVDRLWRQWGDFRILLHQIHVCHPDEALFHPHQSPSAMRLVDGSYQMLVGFSSTHEEPAKPMKLFLNAPDVYEMTDPSHWHAVVPLDRPSHSVMVTGKPWARRSEPSRLNLGPLQPMEKNALFTFFREHFRTPEEIEKRRASAEYGHETHD